MEASGLLATKPGASEAAGVRPALGLVALLREASSKTQTGTGARPGVTPVREPWLGIWVGRGIALYIFL